MLKYGQEKSIRSIIHKIKTNSKRFIIICGWVRTYDLQAFRQLDCEPRKVLIEDFVMFGEDLICFAWDVKKNILIKAHWNITRKWPYSLKYNRATNAGNWSFLWVSILCMFWPDLQELEPETYKLERIKKAFIWLPFYGKEKFDAPIARLS
jgi:hypothetical protein